MVAIGLAFGTASFELPICLAFFAAATILARGFAARQWLVVGGLIGILLAPKQQALPFGKYGTITGVVASRAVSRDGGEALRLSSSMGDLSVYGLTKHFEPGERIEVKGVLRKSQALDGSKAIAGRLVAVKAESLGLPMFWSLVASIRGNLESYLKPSDQASWIEALLLSPDPDFDQQSRKQALEVGGGSMLVAGGLHLAVFGFFFLLALQACQIPKPFQIGILLCGFVFYGAMCGFTGALVRAGLVLALYELAPLAKRNPDLLSAVSFGAIFSLCLEPNEIFKFSFLAAMIVYTAIAVMPKASQSSTKLRGLRAMFIRVLWIGAALLPLQWYWFGTAPLLSLITGPFLLLCYPFVMAFTWLGWLLSSLNAGLGAFWLSTVIEPAARGLHLMTSSLAELPALRMQNLPVVSWVLIVVIYILALWPWRRVATPA